MKQFAGTPGENDMSKYTDWYPAEAKPVRVGWYQRDWGCEGLDSAPDYFDGRHWYLGDGKDGKEYEPFYLLRPWRGLKSPAK